MCPVWHAHRCARPCPVPESGIYLAGAQLIIQILVALSCLLPQARSNINAYSSKYIGLAEVSTLLSAGHLQGLAYPTACSQTFCEVSVQSTCHHHWKSSSLTAGCQLLVPNSRRLHRPSRLSTHDIHLFTRVVLFQPTSC